MPAAELLEIDRWALARTAQLQTEILAHFERFEFHPVVSKLQLFCSEDLGAFYLDVLKDRLYTTAPGSHARRSAQTALWHITHSMLRWMAPFLSFTAEEAWKLFDGGHGAQESIFTQTYWQLPAQGDATQAALLVKWARVREVRDGVNKEIEALRTAGGVGSSLQAEVRISADAEDQALLATLGDDLKFVLITSGASVVPGDSLAVQVAASAHTKCERCWHWREDVGSNAEHPTLCGRCTSNLYGAGETRTVA